MGNSPSELELLRDTGMKYAEWADAHRCAHGSPSNLGVAVLFSISNFLKREDFDPKCRYPEEKFYQRNTFAFRRLIYLSRILQLWRRCGEHGVLNLSSADMSKIMHEERVQIPSVKSLADFAESVDKESMVKPVNTPIQKMQLSDLTGTYFVSAKKVPWRAVAENCVCPLYNAEMSPCAMEYASARGVKAHLKTGVHGNVKVPESVDAIECKSCGKLFVAWWHAVEHLLCCCRKPPPPDASPSSACSVCDDAVFESKLSLLCHYFLMHYSDL